MRGSFFKLFSFKSPAPPRCRCPGKVTVMPWAGSRGRPGLNNPGTNRPAGAGRAEGVQQPLRPQRPSPGGLDLGQLSVVGGGLCTPKLSRQRLSWSFPWRGVKAALPWLGMSSTSWQVRKGSFPRFGFPCLPWGRGEGAFYSVRSAASPRNALS